MSEREKTSFESSEPETSESHVVSDPTKQANVLQSTDEDYVGDLPHAQVHDSSIGNLTNHANHPDMDDLSKARSLALRTLDDLNRIADEVYQTAQTAIASIAKEMSADDRREQKNKIRHELQNRNLKIENDAVRLHKVLGMMVSTW